GGGTPQIIMGPNANPVAPPDPEPDVPIPTPPPPPPETVERKATINPQWSGSYRTIRAAWDRWNVDRYGGRSTLYQGSGSGSGTMKGLACYGNQITNLKAISIEKMVLIVKGAGLASSGASSTITLQGSPHGSKP